MNDIDIKIWSFNGVIVRSVELDGEIYFVGEDVARAIGYDNPAVAAMRCADHEDITVNEFVTVGGTTPILLNQAAVYALIYNSLTERALRFKRWFTYTIIPALSHR